MYYPNNSRRKWTLTTLPLRVSSKYFKPRLSGVSIKRYIKGMGVNLKMKDIKYQHQIALCMFLKLIFPEI